MRRFAPVATALVAASLLALHASAAVADELSDHVLEFERRFHETLAGEGIPGGAYAIVANGRVLRLGSFGRTDLNGGQPVDPETVFRLASVSKGFAGTVAALIAREGAFAFEDPISRYRPDFRFQGPHEIITIGNLLSQTTGFVSNAYDNLIEAGKTLDEIIPHFQTIAPICAPGSCYTYQNNTFSLIEPVLESVTQTSYAALLEQRFFEPLGMRNASVGYEPFVETTNRAEPHVRVRPQQWRQSTVNANYYRVGPAAGVNASALDMAEWLIALLGHRPDVLPGEVIDLAMSPAIRVRSDLNRNYWRGHLTDAYYGLGWRVYQFRNEPLIYHGGWVSGYRADISLSRLRDIGLVLLTNAESNVISELTVAFWAPLLNGDPPPARAIAISAR
jgi:beta-lactamase class C